ncbi:homeobox protein 5-like [Hyalella azteca]|uniref:Homeobox protein 5-like n=1 Tax=Hyalella azteca TaxID=294128 RepID=A0A979FPJ5_HYAAZ|nr:homeobox protein 5-like [Hyalella azteca]
MSTRESGVYDEYTQFCAGNGWKALSSADFGKVMKQVFPNVRPRRLGQRGASKYCYSGLRKTYSLPSPHLPDLFLDEGGGGKKVFWRTGSNSPVQNNNNNNNNNDNNSDNNNYNPYEMVVLEWARETLLKNTITDKNNSNVAYNNNNVNNVKKENNGTEVCRKIRFASDPGYTTNNNQVVGCNNQLKGCNNNQNLVNTETSTTTTTAATELGCVTSTEKTRSGLTTMVALAQYLVAKKLVATNTAHAMAVATNSAGDSPPLQRSTVLQLQKKIHDRDQKRKLQDTSPCFSAASKSQQQQICVNSTTNNNSGNNNSNNNDFTLTGLDRQKTRRRSSSSSGSSSANSSRNPSGDSAISGVSSLSSCSSASAAAATGQTTKTECPSSTIADQNQSVTGVSAKMDGFSSRQNLLSQALTGGSASVLQQQQHNNSNSNSIVGSVITTVCNNGLNSCHGGAKLVQQQQQQQQQQLQQQYMYSGMSSNNNNVGSLAGCVVNTSVAGSVVVSNNNKASTSHGGSGTWNTTSENNNNVNSSLGSNNIASINNSLVLKPMVISSSQTSVLPNTNNKTYTQTSGSKPSSQKACSSLKQLTTRYKNITPKLDSVSFKPGTPGGQGPSTAPSRLGQYSSDSTKTQVPYLEDTASNSQGSKRSRTVSGAGVPQWKLEQTNVNKVQEDCCGKSYEGDVKAAPLYTTDGNVAPADEDEDVPNEVTLHELRTVLKPIIGGAVGPPVGATYLAQNSEPCRVQRRACEFAPIGSGVVPCKGTNNSTACTSANASPFTSPQMTPILSRSRHNSGQSSTYLTPRSTPFNHEDNLHLGASVNSTPFVSPLTTPYARSRHSSSQNHRFLGHQIGQLNPGTTIGGPAPSCSGSRSRHSSGARRYPYNVPEDHLHHYAPPSYQNRIQQRRLRNSSGGTIIPASPQSAPLSPLIDGQEFYSSGGMGPLMEGHQGDYRRRHTSAGPLIPNYGPPSVPLNQNQRFTVLSNQQHNLSSFPTSRPSVPHLQLNPVMEVPLGDQPQNLNRPQSVPLPDILTNQPYSLSVPSTPLLHHNQYQGSNHKHLCGGDSNSNNANLLGVQRTGHFNFDTSLPPSCAPTPVPSEFADFVPDPCLDFSYPMPDMESFSGVLENFEPMSESSPPSDNPFSEFNSRQSCSQNLPYSSCFKDKNTVSGAVSSFDQMNVSFTNNQAYHQSSGGDGGVSNTTTTTTTYHHQHQNYDNENASNPFISATHYPNFNSSADNNNTMEPCSSTASTSSNMPQFPNRTPPGEVFSPPGVQMSSTEITLNALNTDPSGVGYCQSVMSDLVDHDAGFGSLDEVFQPSLGLESDQELTGLVLDSN